MHVLCVLLNGLCEITDPIHGTLLLIIESLSSIRNWCRFILAPPFCCPARFCAVNILSPLLCVLQLHHLQQLIDNLN